jgi:hypothetical protein
MSAENYSLHTIDIKSDFPPVDALFYISVAQYMIAERPGLLSLL